MRNIRKEYNKDYIYHDYETWSYGTWLTWTEDLEGKRSNEALYVGNIDFIAMKLGNTFDNIHFKRMTETKETDLHDSGYCKKVNVILEGDSWKNVTMNDGQEKMKELLSYRDCFVEFETTEIPNKFLLKKKLTEAKRNLFQVMDEELRKK